MYINKKLIKCTLAFSLFMMFTFMSNVFAQPAITQVGFKDVNWGASLKESPAEFLLLDFDKNKKLYNYMRKEDSYFIYDIGFYPIYYHFWDDKFVAVRAYFDAEKDQQAFQKLYNNLVAQFGVSNKEEDKNNESQEILFWQTEDAYIRLTYDAVTKKGYLYVYNKKLQKEYSEFLKTIPNSSTTYQNQPDGFENMLWGSDIQELKQLGTNFKENKKTGRSGGFTISGSEKTFMGLPVLEKTYSFWQDKLFAAYVYYKSDDNKQGFDKIYQNLKNTYGEPTNGRYDLTGKGQYYIWAGERTHIMLYYFLDKKESFVFFTSKELYEKAQTNK